MTSHTASFFSNGEWLLFVSFYTTFKRISQETLRMKYQSPLSQNRAEICFLFRLDTDELSF